MMALLKCHECQKDVSSEAKSCPNCGAPVRIPAVKAENEITFGTVQSLGIILLVVGWIWWGATHGSNGTSASTQVSQSSQTDDLSICSASYTIMRQLLKSPTTAKFPFYRDGCTVNNLGNNQWKVTSFVDSQNSFGAMLRTHYAVVLQLEGNDNWKLIDVKTNE